jgi:hypothetical protein
LVLLDFYTIGYNSDTLSSSGSSGLGYDSLRLLVPLHCRIYNISVRTARKTSFPVLLLHDVAIAPTVSKTPFPRIPGVFISPLPRNGCPSIVACTYVAGVFGDPLPISGHILHNAGCGISQLTFHADNECKNEAKAQIVTC